MMNIIFPTILIHGIGGDTRDLENLKASLEDRNVPVYNIEVGNGKIDSIFMNMNTQCRLLSENIESLGIDGKINLIGISQGGLLARCYVEKYSHKLNKVHSLITYGTPHMGIFIPFLEIPYLEYWKNPYKYNDYLETNDFLVYLNNEKYHENMDLYRMNLMGVDNFATIWSSIDQVISPYQSAYFEFYNISAAKNNEQLTIVDFFESDTYLLDKIGLKSLYVENKLFIKKYDCQHEEFKSPKCYLDTVHGESLLNFTLKLL